MPNAQKGQAMAFRPTSAVQMTSRTLGMGAPNDGRQMILLACAESASPTKARMVNPATMKRLTSTCLVSRTSSSIKHQRSSVEDGGGLSNSLDGFDTVFATQILRLEGVCLGRFRSKAGECCRPGPIYESPPWDRPVLLVIWRRSRPAESVAPATSSAMSLNGYM
jgi:hypothetical protein